MGTHFKLLLSTILTLTVLSHQSPSKCPPFYNGSLAGKSCSREYIVCINGIQQNGLCDEGLIFFEKQSKCIDIADSPECSDLSDDQEEEEPDHLFDCTSRADGTYEIGCDNQFMKCVDGHPYPMFCPSSLVFVEKYGRCLESCDDVIESTTNHDETESDTLDDEEVYDEVITSPPESLDSSEEPTTSEHDDEEVEFDCTNLNDGQYTQGCSEFFYSCVSGEAFKNRCPSGLVYNPAQRACDHECLPITTSNSAPTATTSSNYESTTLAAYTRTTTAVSNDEPTTQVYEQEPTTPGFDPVNTTVAFSTTTSSTTTTTQVPVCPEGQIITFGQCASRFQKCRNNAIRSKQCPANTLFEPLVLLCVFDSPQCQPSTVPLPVYGRPDVVVSPFDDGQKHQYDAFDSVKIIENPFFVPSRHPRPPHHKKHHDKDRKHKDYEKVLYSPFSTSSRRRVMLDDSFKGHRRVRMGRIPHVKNRRSHGKREFRVADEFNGHRSKFLTSNINQVFQRGNSKRRLGPREYPDDYEDASGFEPKDLFGATRRKRSVDYSNQQYTDASSYGSSTNQVSMRQARVNADCRPFTKPVFLSFGDCFDQFIYCSGTGINRLAACPLGEAFDRATGSCSETCSASSTPVTPVTTTVASDQPSSSYHANDASTTTVTPISYGQRCAQYSNALISMGCSQEYIQCSSGVAIRKLCPAALYFDESRALCDYRETVAECTDTTTSSPSHDSDETSTYSPVMKPYNPTSVSQDKSVPSTHTDACFGLSDGSHGEGCSASYIVCRGGKLVKTLTCSLGQGFDPSVQLCRPFDQIPGWACDSVKTTTDAGLARPLPYISLDSVKTSTADYGYDDSSSTTTASYNTYVESGADDEEETSEEILVETTTSEYEESPSYGVAVPAEEDDGEIENNEEVEAPTASDATKENCKAGTKASLGFCLGSYLECINNGFKTQSCPIGHHFDGEQNKCVSEDQCGHSTIKKIVQDTISSTAPVSYRTTDRRCFNAAENSVKPLGVCRESFIRCTNGQAAMESCPAGKIFSSAKKSCVDPQDVVAECGSQQFQPVKSTIHRPSNGGDAFCDGKIDGLFKNPGDCSGILQCFGGDMFEYPPCPSGFAFNEKVGKCDYPHTVPGCEKANDSQGECDDHGAFIANNEDCSSFYRCVWGRKIGMKCPQGTVFNPALSVCDWPISVPSCGKESGSVDVGSAASDN